MNYFSLDGNFSPSVEPSLYARLMQYSTLSNAININ